MLTNTQNISFWFPFIPNTLLRYKILSIVETIVEDKEFSCHLKKTFYTIKTFYNISLEIGISTCHFWVIWNLESWRHRVWQKNVDICNFRTPLKTRKAWQTHNFEWWKNLDTFFNVFGFCKKFIFLSDFHEAGCTS